MAGAEIVDRNADPDAAQGRQGVQSERLAFHDAAFGQFQRDPLRRHAGFGKHPGQASRQILLQQLLAGQVDVHDEAVERNAQRVPSFQCQAGLADHPLAHLDDQAGILGDRDEMVGRNRALRLILPAHQGLGTADVPAFQADHRLVMHRQRALLECAAQSGFEMDAPHRALGDALLVKVESVAPAVLGLVHRRVGMLHQRLGVPAVLRVQADADAGGNMQRVIADDQHLFQRLDDFFRHVRGGLAIPQIFQQDHELVAAQTGECILFAQQHPDAPGHGLQHGIADGVAETVVDRLEPVQVDEQHGQPACRAVGTAGGMGQPVRQQHPIRQAGQRIVIRDVFQVRVLLLQRLLRLLPFGDVLHRADHARRVAPLVQLDFRAFMHDPDRAIRAHDAMIDLVWHATFEGAPDRGIHVRAVIGMHPRKESLVTGAEFIRRDAEHAIDAFRPEQPVLSNLPIPVSHVGDALRLGETLHGFAQLARSKRDLPVLADEQQQRRRQAEQQQGDEAVQRAEDDAPVGLVKAGQRVDQRRFRGDVAGQHKPGLQQLALVDDVLVGTGLDRWQRGHGDAVQVPDQQARRRTSLARTAGDIAAEHAGIQVGVFHAEHDEVSCIHDGLDRLGQRERAALSIGHAAQRGQEDEASPLRMQARDHVVDAVARDKGGMDVGMLLQFAANLGFDRAIGFGGIADDDDFPDGRVDPAHQTQVGRDFLPFEHARHARGVEPRPDAVIIDPGKEHRHSGKHTVQMGEREREGVVVGDVDRRRPIPLVLLRQVCADQVGVGRTVAGPLGIEIFHVEGIGTAGIRVQGVDEALMLALAPGVFLAVGVQYEDRRGNHGLGGKAEGQQEQQSQAHGGG